jgi:glucose/arabinose dehydrogenase
MATMSVLTRLLPGLCVVVAAATTAACGESPPTAPTRPTHPPPAEAPAAAAPAGLVKAPVAVPVGLAQAPFDQPRQVLVPDGWTLSVWARVPGARLAAWTPDGALLVSRPDAGEVVLLRPTGHGVATVATLVAGLTQPHGLAFDGNTLYVAESDQIDAYHYTGGSLSRRRVVVAGLPDAKSPELGGAYAHALKSVVVAPDHSLFFSIGSTGNVSPEDRTAALRRGAIMHLPPGGGPPEVFALGVRNGTGLAVAPDGSVWTAVNNRDQIAYPYHRSYGAVQDAYGKIIPGYVADHPPEELARLTPGRDLGWPYCNPDQDVHPGVPGTAYDYTQPPFMRDVQTNPDGVMLECGALPPIEQTFGAHSAPLGLSFTTLPAPFGQGALVGVHGSWNRTPASAPEVSFFAWQGSALGPQRTLVGGLQMPDGSRWGRPVAAVPGPDGAVYITDDQAGAVYRLAVPR